MRIIRAFSFLSLALITVQPAVAAETLTKPQISQQIIGKTLVGSRKGMRVRMTYNVDGTVAVKAFVMSLSGTWDYSDNGVCMQMTSGPRKGETCTTFERAGANSYLNSEGVVLTVQD